MSEKNSYRIGELAEEFNISLRSLRFYEDRGLIKPSRIGSNRIYSNSDRQKLQLILRFKKLGFSLSETKGILEIYGGKNVRRSDLESVRNRLHEQKEFLIEQSIEIERARRLMEETLAQVNRILEFDPGNVLKY